MLPKAISDAMVGLIINEPFYAHVVSQLNIIPSTKVPIAAVRLSIPLELHVNPEAFEELIPAQRAAVLKHEVLHLVMEHFMRREKRFHELWNVTADLAINELLPESSLPEGSLTVESMEKALGISLPSRAAAEVYYDKLKNHVKHVVITVMVDGDQCQSGSGSNPDSQSDKQPGGRIRIKVTTNDGKEAEFNGLDMHPEDGQPGFDSDVTGEMAQEIIREIIKSAAKSCGNMPAGLDEYITAMDKDKINWRRMLSRFLLGRGRMIATPTYLRESRRYDLFPGRRKTVGMEALVAIDTSGSMSSEELQAVVGHLLKIKKISGTKIWVTWGDMQREGGPLPIEKVGTRLKLTGRGGTDLRWPFKLATKMRIPAVVYFTDGYGPAPESAPQKVLWVLTSGGQKPADYGMTVKFAEGGN